MLNQINDHLKENKKAYDKQRIDKIPQVSGLFIPSFEALILSYISSMLSVFGPSNIESSGLSNPSPKIFSFEVICS